jgi:NodT family efflux transporter outer membrane factor (OMF) lipoprotein
MSLAIRMRASAVHAVVAMLVGCAVGSDYQRPAAPVPARYKELAGAPAGWKVAAPADMVDRGSWWTIYRDPLLDELETQIDVGNQNLKAFEAAYRQARAVVNEARSNLFPTLSVASAANRSRSNDITGTAHLVEANASWDLDIWGKVRRQVQSDRAAAQASAAELAAVRLSAQADLATFYFQLRYQDSLQRLLNDTAAADRRSLTIARNQYEAGIVSQSDVITAETQLQTTQAQLLAVGVSRAQFEHAIALLTGQPPSEVTIPVAEMTASVPTIPVTLPSTLLERRPDIAQAERSMERANALIGVAIATYYPDISLSAAFGYAQAPLHSLISASSQVWSVAASGTQLVSDGGGRSAAVAAARATYDQSVANYRQSVLSAFKDVEDALSSLRILAQQAEAQAAAVALARRAVEIALNEYKAGTQSYTAVVTAQTTALSNEQTALQVEEARLAQSVALMKALGGGWNETDAWALRLSRRGAR